MKVSTSLEENHHKLSGESKPDEADEHAGKRDSHRQREKAMFGSRRTNVYAVCGWLMGEKTNKKW